MAGVDFLVNVTVSPGLTLTGVFAGDLELAHAEAVRRLAEYVSIPLQKEYDIVLTHGGFVGINHYQAAKAAVEAIPVLKPGGRLILVTDDTDRDPVGSQTYRTLLHIPETERFRGFPPPDPEPRLAIRARPMGGADVGQGL